MTRYQDKVVLITGSGAGIGRHYAHRFAAEGASIVVTDVDPAAADRVVGELAAQERPAIGVQMDVTEADAVQAAVDTAVERFGGIDVLVNNAGVHLEHAQLPHTLEAVPAWRRVLEVNVLGVLTCSAACRPAMAGRDAAIVNHSSMAAYMGGGAYSASKLALNSLTVSTAAEFAADGIRVNGIAPGLVDSEAAVAWMDDPARKGIQDALVAGQMLQRPGRMTDLADVALWLCSPEAAFVTGQTIVVDGGYLRKPF